MMQYIFDFISILFDKIDENDKIKNIILFGSFARGNPKKNSDIDLFIDTDNKNKENITKVVRESLNEFEIKAEKSWYLKGIKNPIVPIIDNLDAKQWEELKREIGSYGILLYGRYNKEIEKNNHKVLIEYNLSKLKQKNKMKVLRKLFGYKLKNKKKLYSQEGLSKELKAEKISNAILVDIANYKKILNFLRESKVIVKIRELWA